MTRPTIVVALAQFLAEQDQRLAPKTVTQYLVQLCPRDEHLMSDIVSSWFHHGEHLLLADCRLVGPGRHAARLAGLQAADVIQDDGVVGVRRRIDEVGVPVPSVWQSRP